MKLLTGVLSGYLRPGSEFRRCDVAGMLADRPRWLPPGTLFGEGDTVWEVAYIGERGALISDGGEVLWSHANGHRVLASTEQVAGRLGL